MAPVGEDANSFSSIKYKCNFFFHTFDKMHINEEYEKNG